MTAVRGSAHDVPGEAGDTAMAGGEAAPPQRLDKWLWYARIVKSRSLAATFIETGKVRHNKVRVTKPAQLVRAGDVLTVSINHKIRILKVLEPGKRRGPASEAQALYEELTPPPVHTKSGDANDARMFEPAASGKREAGRGRPTKRDRRLIDRFRDGAD